MLSNRQPATGLTRVPLHHGRVHKQLRWPSLIPGARDNDLNSPPTKCRQANLPLCIRLCQLSKGPGLKSKKATEKRTNTGANSGSYWPSYLCVFWLRSSHLHEVKLGVGTSSSLSAPSETSSPVFSPPPGG